MFGAAVHLLDGDPLPRRLSNATPPPATSPQPMSSPGLHRHPTGSSLAAEGALPPIPSSTTPSPMKMPLSNSKDGGEREAEAEASVESPILSLGPSPAKVSNEVTKALQDSITSLLGKRRTPEEEAAAHTHKPGKRVRPPPKSKVS